MSLSLLSFNARGLRNNLKRKAIFLFLKKFKCDFYFVQEAHNTSNDIRFWKSQWGRELWGAHKSEKAAGVLALRGNFSGEIIAHESDLEGHFVIFVLSRNSKIFLVINIYGYNSRTENMSLFEVIDVKIETWLGKFPNAYIILGGDFNVVLNNELDRFPTKRDNAFNSYLKVFMEKYDLYDIFRAKSPLLKAFTWRSKDMSKQSRLDFWLISKTIPIDMARTKIHPAPFSDHEIVTLNITLTPTSDIPRAVCWKLNNSLLTHALVLEDIQKIITSHFEQATLQNSYSLQWELMKFEVGKYMRKYSTELSKQRRLAEVDLCADIAALTNQSVLNVEEQIKLSECQNRLDNIYRKKAEGAFIRSRTKWLEEGEQCSSYFFNLEKSKTKKQTIDSLKINEKIVTDPKTIASFCSNYYSTLYSSNYDPGSAIPVLESVASCKTITNLDKEWCEKPIALAEVQNAIKYLKINKSPGNDGLSGEFYKTFAESIAPFLQNLFTESITKGCLPPSLSQGLITLIPKPKKDTLCLENWRPICLLNTDYKILAFILASRIKKLLPDIINESQSGFMANRHISNNIRLVLDLLDYSDLIAHDSFILFLDFYKAFDTLEHEFIYHSLAKFGFGPLFIGAIKTLYTECNSAISLKYGTSPRFAVARGVRQGCPAAPYLFLLAAQILSAFIVENNVQGIPVAGREVLISQVADDTTLFLRDAEQIPKAVNIIEQFSKASGLCLNLHKCELLAIKTCNHTSLHGIPVKEAVTYLGVVITKDENERSKLNFEPTIEKAKKRFNQWLQRDLSLNGRILLTKTEGISRLIYSAMVLHVDPNTGRAIDKMMYNFVWKNKTHYIKNSVITNTTEAGGLNFLDFVSLNNTFKVNWLRSLLSNPKSIWNFIPNFIFSKLGGLLLLLRCNYNVEKLPIQLSKYHKQMLLAWLLLFKHSFSPHSFLIWNNQNILYKNKSLFFSNWADKGIVYVKQLFNNDGNLLNYSEFLNAYQFPVTPKEFCVVMDAIPNGVLTLFKGFHSFDTSFEPVPVTETAVGKICFSASPINRNRKIRSLFQKSIVTVPYVIHYWRSYVKNINWEKVWTLPNKFFISNKQREITYKLLHRCYPVKHKVRTLGNTSCTFCDSDTETSIHLFWSCPFSTIFWKYFVRYIHSKITTAFTFHFRDMLFGFPNQTSDKYYIINLLILMAKFYIHKSKVRNKKPLFVIFKSEIKCYKESIQCSTYPKALKTCKLIEKFHM